MTLHTYSKKCYLRSRKKLRFSTLHMQNYENTAVTKAHRISVKGLVWALFKKLPLLKI